MTWFDPVKAAAAPYLFWIKVAFMAVLFLGGLFTGCQLQENRDDKKVVKAQSAVLYYRGQAETNALALEEVNKQYKANAQAAREWQDRATATANEVAKQKEKNNKDNSKWAAELAKLKKDPDCKAIMESKICSIESF